MDGVPDGLLALNPFAALTMVAAPALLTNASSVLAMSSSNRFLRASERIRALRTELEALPSNGLRAHLLLAQTPRVEKQAILLLSGLGAAYVALGSFAAATLVSLIGAAVASYPQMKLVSEATIVLALAAGLTGVSSLIFGSVRLFQATRLAVLNIVDEARCIREERESKLGQPVVWNADVEPHL